VATGILFLPSGFRNAGLGAGIATLMVIGVLALYGMMLLIDTQQYIVSGGPTGDTPRTPLLSASAATAVSNALFPMRKKRTMLSYSELGRICFGYWGKRIVESSIVFAQLGFCCVYISFIGNSVSNLIKQYPSAGEVWPLWVYMVLAAPSTFYSGSDAIAQLHQDSCKPISNRLFLVTSFFLTCLIFLRFATLLQFD